LRPKKYKEVAKKLSKEKDWDEELVTDAVYFFYSKVRKTLSSLEAPSVLIPKLGTFKIRKQKFSKMIEEKERLVSKLNPHEFSKYDSYRTNKEALEKLTNLKGKFEILKQEKDDFIKNKDSEA
jgi:nucleoid DNA-binding protein